MTDLEMTKLCAEAMAHKDYGFSASGFIEDGKVYFGIKGDGGRCLYDPLHNDAQAMALVKKFRLQISCDSEAWWAMETVTAALTDSGDFSDLNRAIVECVAKMMEVETTA